MESVIFWVFLVFLPTPSLGGLPWPWPRCAAPITGLLFYWHLDTAGLARGTVMALTAISVATTQFCLGGWVWHWLGFAGGARGA